MPYNMDGTTCQSSVVIRLQRIAEEIQKEGTDKDFLTLQNIIKENMSDQFIFTLDVTCLIA